MERKLTQRLLGAAVALLAASTVSAITPAGPAVQPLPGGGWRVLYPTSIGSIPASTSGRTWEAIGAGMRVRDATTFTAKGGALAIQATRVAGWDIVAAAIARCMASGPAVAVCGVATATGAYLYDHARLKSKSDGQPYWDDGDTPAAGQSEYFCHQSTNCSLNPGPNWSSPAAACEAYVQLQRDSPGGSAYTWFNNGVVQNNPPHSWNTNSQSWGICNLSWTNNSTGNTGSGYALISVTGYGSAGQCPAMTDPLNPAYNTPAGPPDADGKCPSGRYQGITAEQAAPKVYGGPGATTVTPPSSGDYPAWADRYQDSVEHGVDPSTPPVVVTGPASQTGQPTTTTTTNPDGSTTTTTKTPTYNYTYEGDTITYNTVVTTVTQHCVGGSCNTTTTVEQGPGAEASDLCKDNPDIAACQKLGEPPPAEAIPKENIPVTWTPVAFSAPAGCPAPITWTYRGVTHNVGNFQPMCDLMTLLRALFLATGAAAAAWIFLEGFKA